MTHIPRIRQWRDDQAYLIERELCLPSRTVLVLVALALAGASIVILLVAL